MSKYRIIALKKPGEITSDPLTELLRSGARKLIADAVEVELQQLLSQYASLKNEQGHQQVVRNGYLPEREVQTGIGPIEVKLGFSVQNKDLGAKPALERLDKGRHFSRVPTLLHYLF